MKLGGRDGGVGFALRKTAKGEVRAGGGQRNRHTKRLGGQNGTANARTENASTLGGSCIRKAKGVCWWAGI